MHNKNAFGILNSWNILDYPNYSGIFWIFKVHYVMVSGVFAVLENILKLISNMVALLILARTILKHC